MNELIVLASFISALTFLFMAASYLDKGNGNEMPALTVISVGFIVSLWFTGIGALIAALGLVRLFAVTIR